MIYQDADGNPSFSQSTDNEAPAKAVKLLQTAVKAIDEAYEHLTTGQQDKLKAMAGHLIAMLEDE